MMSSTDPQTPGARLGFEDPNPSYVPEFLKPVTSTYTKYSRQYQALLDRAAPHMLQRWLATAGLVAIFLCRIILSQGVSPRPSFYCVISLIHARKVVYRLVIKTASN